MERLAAFIRLGRTVNDQEARLRQQQRELEDAKRRVRALRTEHRGVQRPK